MELYDTVEVPAEVMIPRKLVEAAVEAEVLREALRMILGSATVPMVTVPKAEFRIPWKAATPVAVPKVVPTFDRLVPVVRLPMRKLGLVELPMVFPEILKVPLPAVLIPVMPPQVEAEAPMASRAPKVLF